MSEEQKDITAADLARDTAPKSDQLNAEDLLAGPITVRVARIRRGASPEQPWDVHHDGGKPWRPCKTMRRLLIMAWGADPAAWVGRRLTLYRDPGVRFGGDAIGGIRVSHMDGLDGRLSVMLADKRGHRSSVVVEPLGADPLTVLLSEYGISEAAYIGWAASKGRTGGDRAKIAGWLRADPSRIEALQTWTPTPPNEVAQ